MRASHAPSRPRRRAREHRADCCGACATRERAQVNEAAEIIYDLVDPNANLIFGAVVDHSLEDCVSITIIATGFGTVEPEIGALRASAPPRAVPAAPAAPPAQQQVAARGALVGDGAAQKQQQQEEPGSVGGIEIPAFLRRRRLQGK